jgi:exonuclease I
MEKAARKIGTDPVFRKWGLSLFFLFALPAWGYDANGVALGAPEADVRKAFPSARCRALEWQSRAAERRCDDAKIAFGGVQARITLYLKDDRVQAFDVRFDERDLERVTGFLKSRYGQPLAEVREKFERRGGETREITKVRWEKGTQRAVLTSQLKGKRVDLSVWLGNFDEEIYRIR